MPILELMNYGTIRGASQMVQWQKYIYKPAGAAGDLGSTPASEYSLSRKR